MKKRLPGILLCLCMVLTIFPTLAFAEGGEGESSVCSCETACAAEAMNTECPVCGAEGAAPESCGKYTVPVCSCETACAAEAMNTECPVCGAEGATPESCGQYKAPAEPTAVQKVQALIDALPAADTITAENRGGVETQLTAIDEAKAALTEEERAALDFTKYEAAIAALNALDGMGGAGTPLPADDTEELQKKLSEAPDFSTVTLTEDYTISSTLTVSNSITLDLAGHVIRMTGSGSVIEVGSILTLADSDPYAAHEDSSLPAGGVITGGNTPGNGGGVLVEGGQFTMEGGTIFGCQADRGGGVYVEEGSFTMNDGAIKGCTAHIEGGGVYANRHFIMNGGAIEDCSAASNGQAVYITETEFAANDGSIKGTVCVDDGRIVTNAGTSYAMFYDQVTIENGSISAGIFYGGIAPGPSVISGSYNTVSFDLGGGSGDIPKQYFVGVVGPYALKPADPTKDGYTFAGWYMDDALTIPFDFESSPVDGSPTLYAKFEDGTTALQKLLNNPPADGLVKLEKDYTISETVQTDANFTLDLNGHVIRMTGSGSVIQSTGIMTLTDSNPTATHADSSLPAGGVITGGKLTEYGGGVLATGVFIMNGGTIYNCRASRGGGVYVGSQFTMNGGAIYNCSAGQHGGGVYCDEGCTFTMTGGAIKSCTASDYGGGVYTTYDFTMNGGTIEDCTAYYGGQAVYITQGILWANGGTIKDTVYVDGNGSSLKGGDIAGCTRFYDQVEIGSGSDIYYGVYYGGIVPGPEVIKAENYHTVDFQVNGGSSIPKQYFVGIDTAAALQPADPTKEGYAFTGWFTDEDLTTPYDFSGAVDKDITLYAGFKPATYTVTYDPGEYGTGSIPAGTKDHGKDFTLSSDTFTRQDWVQTGWTDGSTDYALGGTYSTDANVTLYPLWTPIETMTVPFTTRVTLGDSGVPGETVFTLELVDAGGKPVSAEGVTVSGSVTTNGAGSYGSAMSLAGTAGRLQNMLGQGVFVRQVDAGAAGWTVDGTVWGVRLYEETLDSRAAYALQIFPATVSNGSYVIDASAGPVAQMQFTNVYTAHDYQLKHDEDGHWEECACKDVRNEEPHRFGDWVVTKKPTGTASGLQERECAICHYKEIVWLAPLSPTASPATGDNSKLTLWLALLGASAAGLSAAALYGKRRKGFRH